jgi:hypothetical protein
MSESGKIAAAILTQTVLSSEAGQKAFQTEIDNLKERKSVQEDYAHVIKTYYDKMLIVVA